MYYLGPKGSFSHEAALKISNAIYVEAQSISEIFYKVSSEGKLGIVPIENSLEGPINETLDNLFKFDDVFVNKIIELKINLVLASKGDINIKHIKNVYTHLYAYKEAQNSLLKLGIVNNVIPVESTSKAAILALSDPNSAALCSEFAARLYGLKILAYGVQDYNNNITKFALISKNVSFRGERSMILFTVPDLPGSLYKVLEKFYTFNKNLKMIYSRPVRSIPWNYYFYVEYEGSYEKELLDELKKVTTSLKFKGSYNIT
ncbi:MAG: chorismate mutase [Acidianus infernus]|nr:chorismate mutase [Acidianus infernus]MCY0883478.1 chorismate mutase [Acidianus infernus]